MDELLVFIPESFALFRTPKGVVDAIHVTVSE